MTVAVIETDRLLLRRWRTDDSEPFAALNADPEVMEHFPSMLSRTESDELIERIEAGFVAHGFGMWALELRTTGEFIGFTGLGVPSFEAVFTPTVEVGWRLARRAWGHGYASEAARASLDLGFSEYGLPEVLAFTFEGNGRSRAVMERLGMTWDPSEDFDHPRVPVGSRVVRHVLYRMPADLWLAGDR
jgi:ribosomal-protein-alanine N-acetyltransferase